MNYRALVTPLSYFPILTAVALTVPLVFAFFEPQTHFRTEAGLWITIGISLALGLGMWLAGRRWEAKLRRKEGIVIIGLGWILASLLGALPLYLSGAIPHFLDAAFEVISGYTTTGSTILADIEALPRSMLFWRSFTHWLGGMGIVVLFLTFLPSLGIVDLQLFRIEATGISKSGLLPRIRDTARVLFLIYLGLTVLFTLLFWVGGMGLFDAVCHCFGALATGGYSTKNNSMAYYGTYIHLVTIAAMLAGGINFALYYAALKRNFLFFRDPEFKLFISLLGLGWLVMVLSQLATGVAPLGIALRDGLFTATSMLTCTGFVTADFEKWPWIAQSGLVLLAFAGGCVGSTAGGIKIVRVLITLRWVRNHVWQYARPHELRPTRIGGEPVPLKVESAVAAFAMAYVLWWLSGVLVLQTLGYDFPTSMGSSIAALSNCGPGLGTFGPMDNFSSLHWFGKVYLAWLMIVGRLELLTITAMLVPGFWRR